MARVIVFDAGVLIAHLDRGDVFHGPATGFMEENEELEFVVNVVTLAECLVHPAMAGAAKKASEELAALSLLEVDVVHDDVAPIAELRAGTRLRMSDALVLHTAVKTGADLVTTDRALARAATARGVTAHLLSASLPSTE